MFDLTAREECAGKCGGLAACAERGTQIYTGPAVLPIVLQGTVDYNGKLDRRSKNTEEV
jgi:hypothetical protein